MASKKLSDGLELLVKDHLVFRNLLQKMNSAKTGPEKRAVFNSLQRDLSIHATTEELLIYPLLRNKTAANGAAADHSINEHQQLKDLLQTCEKAQVEDRAFSESFNKISKILSQHMKEEEEQYFPEIRKAVSQEALDDLASAIEFAKIPAPRRPHPLAPNSPPGNFPGPILGFMDRIRDMFRTFAPTDRDRIEKEFDAWKKEHPGASTSEQAEKKEAGRT